MGWTVAIWEFWPCWGVRGLSIRPTRPDDVACHEGLHILAPTTAVLQKKAQAITRKHLEGKLKSARRIGRQMLPGVSRTRVCIRGPGARATFAQVSSVFSSSSMLPPLVIVALHVDHICRYRPLIFHPAGALASSGSSTQIPGGIFQLRAILSTSFFFISARTGL